MSPDTTSGEAVNKHVTFSKEKDVGAGRMVVEEVDTGPHQQRQKPTNVPKRTSHSEPARRARGLQNGNGEAGFISGYLVKMNL